MTFAVLDYHVQKNVELQEIIRSFVKKDTPQDSISESVFITKKKNINIKDWDNLKKGDIVKLYLVPQSVDQEKFKIYKKFNNEKNRSRMSVFLMPSVGYFSQSKTGTAAVKYVQLSPVALGISYGFSPSEKKYSFNTSLYYSYLLSTSNKGDTAGVNASNVSIPPEIGGNIYGEYFYEKENISVYSGIDGEQFSSFDLNGVLNDDKIYLDRNLIFYVTVGIAKNISYNQEKFSMKLSISKSFFGSFESGRPDSLNGAKLSGYKMMLYFNYQVSNKWSIGSLVKYHSFSGDNTLSSLRIGAGINYHVF